MHTYTVQFRISGRTLDPDQVTRRLGLEPNQVRIKGEKRGQNQVWDEALWSYNGGLDADKEWDSVEEGLQYVLEKLSGKKALLQEYAKSHDAIWWCGHFQSGFDGGPTLSATLLGQLGDFGVPLYLDNYFRDNDA